MVLELSLPHRAEPARLSLRPESTTVAADCSAVYDRDGRLVTLATGDAFYRRSLDHRFLEKQRQGAGGRGYRTLSGAASDALVHRAHADLRTVLAALPAAQADARERLVSALAFGPAAYAREREQYHALYSPITILPPDQYGALVLQATVGCHYNACTFCSFYRGIRFQARSAAAFGQHVAGVRQLVGRGVRLRRSVFLGDANALLLTQSRLVSLLAAIGGAFEMAPPGMDRAARTRWMAAHPDGLAGVYSFQDAFTGTPRPAEQFAELAALGLRRIYIGMETGHVPLLSFLRKPSMPEQVAEVVAAARAGGVAVGVIAMLGIGGTAFAEGHVADTAALLNRLPLGDDDLIYLSPFAEEAGSEYAALAEAEGIASLTDAQQEAQARALHARLRLPPGVKVARYNIREFIY